MVRSCTGGRQQDQRIGGRLPQRGEEPCTNAAGGKRDTYCLLGWDDLRKLRDSGLVELDSHGHRHNPVRVGTEAGTPISLARYSRLHDVPIEYGDGYDEAAIRAADGTPRWPAQPL